MKNSYAKQPGFTIVELLIVIVVIGILAAISIVAYVGVTNSAYNNVIKSDLVNFAKSMELYRVENDTYPATASKMVTMGKYKPKLSRSAYKEDNNNGMICILSDGDQQKFAFAAMSKSGKKYYVSSTTGVSSYGGAWASGDILCPNIGGIDTSATGAWRSWAYTGGVWANLTTE